MWFYVCPPSTKKKKKKKRRGERTGHRHLPEVPPEVGSVVHHNKAHPKIAEQHGRMNRWSDVKRRERTRRERSKRKAKEITKGRWIVKAMSMVESVGLLFHLLRMGMKHYPETALVKECGIHPS